MERLIAFEGLNRSGKGTQLNLLKEELSRFGLGTLELRGDGTRDGLGEHQGDPLSPWWQEFSQKLRHGGQTHEWHYAAYQLAMDLAAWREKTEDIILLDRSLLSRAAFVIDRERPSGILEIENLYPVQVAGKVELKKILPDVIFELIAPKEILLSRLDSNDPKLKFRASIIEGNYDTFYKAKERLPKVIKERIITIDSSQPIDKVFDDILENLNLLKKSRPDHAILGV